MPEGGGQRPLFELPRPERERSAVAASTVPDDLVECARRLPRSIRLGTSSWSFPGWTGIVYDREASPATLSRKGLEAYARHPLLRTVGVDRTYYAPIPASAFAEYAAMVPEEFRFLVKACNECTSPRRFGDRSGERNEHFLEPAWASDEVVGPFVEGLGEKAGPLVFQFSPLGGEFTREPGRFAERLGAFVSALPRGPLYAVEIRDRELLGSDYVATLAAAHARHCFAVHPRMPSPAEQQRVVGVDGPLVVRWMLHAGLGYEQAQDRYRPFSRLVDEDPSTRESLADMAADRAVRGQNVFVIANNKAEGSAPLTVFALARRILE